MRSIVWLSILLISSLVQPASAAVSQKAPRLSGAEELYAFYAGHMQSTLDQIEKGEHRLPFIEKRVAYLFAQIEKHHGARPAINAIPDYHPRDPMIASGSAINKSGRPVIVLAVPVFRALYENQRARGEEAFANSLVVTVLNEAAFLATGTVVTGSAQDQTRRYMTIWADTCDTVVLPLLAAKEKVLEDEEEHCKAWVAGGRTMISIIWNNFIKARYGSRP